VITSAFNLRANAVIHAVGPQGESKRNLANCYVSILDLVTQNRFRSVVIPVISGGAYNYPSSRSASVALKAIRAWLSCADNRSQIDRIVLCVFTATDCREYAKALARIFPTEGTLTLYRTMTFYPKGGVVPKSKFRMTQACSVAQLSGDSDDGGSRLDRERDRGRGERQGAGGPSLRHSSRSDRFQSDRKSVV
jgi:hypothetical protein